MYILEASAGKILLGIRVYRTCPSMSHTAVHQYKNPQRLSYEVPTYAPSMSQESNKEVTTAVAYLVGLRGEHDALPLEVGTPLRPLALELVRLLQPKTPRRSVKKKTCKGV